MSILNKLVVLDCEVFPNYFLVAFKNLDNNKIKSVEAKGLDNSLPADRATKITNILTKYNTFGFNSRNYDIPIILYALSGKTCNDIFKLSNWIIDGNKYGGETLRTFSLCAPYKMSHFDIQEPSQGVRVSLKLYGGRMNSKQLQDLPIEVGTHLNPQQMEDIKTYCINDLNTTIDLYNNTKNRLELREKMSAEYKLDLMSKSDAQIAESVIKSEIQKRNPEAKIFPPRLPVGASFRYNPPSYIRFKGKQLKVALDFIKKYEFKLDGKGSIRLPEQLKNAKIILGEAEYQLGIGGIHSTEKKQSIVPNKNQLLLDRDVASYYPSIILNLNLFPLHLGEDFLSVYKLIVERRLEAKRTGDKVLNESLKIVINGSFGKLGNKWSVLYSPDLMMATTLTGQLSLLMLIEELELNDIRVVSANTDGLVSLMNKGDYYKYNLICKDWQTLTKFELEESRYEALYSRDVNNYLAVSKHAIKGKGIFSINSLNKNPRANISVKAVVEFLTKGTPIVDTISRSKDLRDFISIRTVRGGAVWRGKYLGKVVRWIYSTDGDIITYKKTNNRVAETKGARPVMTLGEFPTDIDYRCYEERATRILEDIGVIENEN